MKLSFRGRVTRTRRAVTARAARARALQGETPPPSLGADLHGPRGGGRPLQGQLTVRSVSWKISLASSKEHCSSLHSLSREPDLSSSRNELARLCLCKTPWASSWVRKTERWESHEH